MNADFPSLPRVSALPSEVDVPHSGCVRSPRPKRAQLELQRLERRDARRLCAAQLVATRVEREGLEGLEARFDEAHVGDAFAGADWELFDAIEGGGVKGRGRWAILRRGPWSGPGVMRRP